ncbi:MAG TPA: hypothetical protein PKL69_02510 [Agitococcus sp.]|nr:hypothetical protein [Agitococcus sp.]HMX99175.1 hypothetical protein [Agitococcus sp.]HNA20641.1 hypothetical protein [Agitococcus sp.]HNB19497.1 hypothetical protein [Agitococcus sp.]HNL79208.1 hypothetical protein [Agitococcus sp.]
MFKYSSKIIITLLTCSLFTACSSTPTNKSLVKEQLSIEKQRRNAAQDLAEQTLDTMPSWAMTAPRPDNTGVYAVGVAESDKVQIAIKKAQLQAQYGLAKIFNQELAGSEQMMQQDAGAGSSSSYQSLIQSLVNYVPVVGFEVVKQEVKAVNGEFQAYTLLKLPYVEFNKALQSQKQQAQNTDMKQAFADLERRLQQHQLQKK